MSRDTDKRLEMLTEAIKAHTAGVAIDLPRIDGTDVQQMNEMLEDALHMFDSYYTALQRAEIRKQVIYRELSPLIDASLEVLAKAQNVIYEHRGVLFEDEYYGLRDIGAKLVTIRDSLRPLDSIIASDTESE